MMPRPSDFSEDTSRMIEHGERIAADMALIAAAPKMLAALKLAAAALAAIRGEQFRAAQMTALDAARAAIAEAEEV